MKVSNNKIGNATPNAVDSAKGKKTSDAAAVFKNDVKAGSLSAKDSSKVDVSERAQMMQKAKAIAGDNSVDDAKVARLQKLIDEGKYKVDSDKIAERLLDEHLSMPDSE